MSLSSIMDLTASEDMLFNSPFSCKTTEQHREHQDWETKQQQMYSTDRNIKHPHKSH